MEKLRKHHNNIKNKIIKNQKGNVLDVRSLAFIPCDKKQHYDFVNLFFCLTQIDIVMLVEILNNVCRNKVLISGIAIFEDDEQKLTFKEFNDVMIKYFACRRITVLSSGTLSGEMASLNNKYSRFEYVRHTYIPITKQLINLTNIIESSGHKTELEIRTTSTTLPIIPYEYEWTDNSYIMYQIYNADQNYRLYKNSNKKMFKSLILDYKKEVQNFKYKICVSAEKELKTQPANLMTETERIMKRHEHKLDWNGILFVSHVDTTYEIEVEFSDTKDILLAERYIYSLTRKKPNIKEGERFVFCSNELGIWSWDCNHHIENLSNICGINILLLIDNNNKIHLINNDASPATKKTTIEIMIETLTRAYKIIL